MNTQRGFANAGILIAIVLGLVVLGGGAYYFTQQTPSPALFENNLPTDNQPQETQSTDTVSNTNSVQTTASLSNHAVGTVVENLFNFLQKTPNVPGTSYPLFKYQNNQIVFVGSTKDQGCVVPVSNPEEVKIPVRLTRAQTINGALSCNTILAKPDSNGLCNEATSYLIEDSTLFNDCKKVGQVDVAHFRFLTKGQLPGIYTDGKVVGMQVRGDENVLISGIAEPEKLEAILDQNGEASYFKDSKNVYFLKSLYPETGIKTIIISNDISNFAIIASEPYEVGTLYAKDRVHIYSDENTLPTTNISAFETFGRGQAFAVDESRIYLRGGIIHSGINKADAEVYLQNSSPDWEGPPSAYSVFIKDVRTGQWYKQDSSSPIPTPSASEIGTKLFPRN